MTDRDAFAAAALTGILSRGAWVPEECVTEAYRLADAMLSARKPPPRPSGVAEAYATAQQFSDAQDFVRDREEFEEWRKSKAAPAAGCHGCSGTTPKSQTCHKAREENVSDSCTGSTIDVEELLKELSDVSGMATVGDDVRATCRDAASAIERLRAWVNELQLSRAEIGALQHVVEDGRFVDLGDYGRLRSLLVRLRPEWEDDTPRPPTTPPQGSVPDEGSVSDSREWNEPVAWATFYPNGSTASVYIGRVPSHAVPLYRQPQPTLGDGEREAVKLAADFLEDEFYGCSDKCASEHNAVDALRKLLERTK